MQICIIQAGKEKKRRKRVTLHPEFKRQKMINTILAEQVVATVNETSLCRKPVRNLWVIIPSLCFHL